MKKSIPLGLAFDDVLLIPRKSSVLPSSVNLATSFSRGVSLKVPLSAAAMDTVSEFNMAVAMARGGGIAIIHRNMPVWKQVEEVVAVKRYRTDVIGNPHTLSPRSTTDEARELMGKFGVSGIPIVNGNRLLKGILTLRDLRAAGGNISVSKIMTAGDKLITGTPNIMTTDAERLMLEHRIEKLPLVNDTFQLVGLITLRDIKEKELSPFANLDKKGQLCVGAAVGATGDYEGRALELAKAGCNVIVIDTAHGHSQNVLNAVRTLKRKLSIDVVAGNIATGKAARDLVRCGVDAVKVGIGPGSICTTRVVTGVGVPQITALMDVASAVKSEITIIADGGIKYEGDVAKALAAGAHSVMCGSMFAGTEEAPGETVVRRGHRYKTYRGMGSAGVLRAGGDRYGKDAVPEGVEAIVPYKGPIARQLHAMTGALRQSMGYLGCRTVRDMRKHARFVRVTHAGVIESRVHDVVVEESPTEFLS